MNKDNQNVLTVVDEALERYKADSISVDISDTGRMIDVNLLCNGAWSDYYMVSVAKVEKCDLEELKQELDKRDVIHF